MDLKQLDLNSLDHLLRAAAREQQRRQQRKPIREVRGLLYAAAAEEGYDLSDVFPELDIPSLQGLMGMPAPGPMMPPGAALGSDTTPAPTASAVAAVPVDATPTARASGSRGASSSSGKAATNPPDPFRATPAPVENENEAVARKIAQALARIPHSDVVATALDAVLISLNMQAHWSLFHAGMEEASRRNWVHFRGNSHCVLTQDGARAASEG